MSKENGSSHCYDGLFVQSFSVFNVQTLVVDSQALRGNPLGDTSLRHNPALVPKSPPPPGGWPVVLVLAGFTGNGPNYFNQKTFERNFPEVLNSYVERGEAPLAIYVFCEAMTFWGGSQFVNSKGTGRYGDYIIEDLIPAVRRHLPTQEGRDFWCVMGGSSGGYGALHLASSRPDIFGYFAAIAPDSFFEASLLPEIYQALPLIEKLGGMVSIKGQLESGKLTSRKDSHTILNVIAMGLCYAPKSNGEFEIPIDAQTGVLRTEIWERWKHHDPVVFLSHRTEKLRQVLGGYLDVGIFDQFHLQYGARQIRDVLRQTPLKLHYSEFEGTHFDIGDRRPQLWKWLGEVWSPRL